MEAYLFIAALVCALVYWYTAQQAKTFAVVYARRECEKHGVQLLDQTVQQIKLSMSRNVQNRWQFWREYRFDYSTDGVNRYEGRLVMLGHRLLRSALETSDPVIH